MDNLKLVLTAVLFGIVAIGGMVYFERNLGIPRLVWAGPPFVLFLAIVIWPKWGGYNKFQKNMAALLLAPITLLVLSVIVNTYVWVFFDYSRVHLLIAMAPFIIYGIWYVLTIKQKKNES